MEINKLNLNLFIAKEIFNFRNVTTVKCRMCPDSGCPDIIGHKKSINENSFFHHAILSEFSIKGVENFYEEYYSTNDIKDWYSREKFINDSLSYNGYHAYCYQTLPDYLRNIKIIRNVIDKAISKKIVNKKDFENTLNKFLFGKKGVYIVCNEPLVYAKALYLTFKNKKIKKAI